MIGIQIILEDMTWKRKRGVRQVAVWFAVIPNRIITLHLYGKYVDELFCVYSSLISKYVMSLVYNQYAGRRVGVVGSNLYCGYKRLGQSCWTLFVLRLHFRKDISTRPLNA